MRDATERWLSPMMEAAERDLPPGTFEECLKRATMPASEAADEGVDATGQMLEGAIPAGAFGALDWVVVGRLLRDRLGWDHYPEYPPEQ
jgi:hypothetical protein